MAFNLVTVLTVLFSAYVIHSLYGIWELFVIPVCLPNQPCVEYYLKSNPNLQILIYTSVEKQPSHENEFSYLGRIRNFTYDEEFEKVLTIPVPRQTQNNGTLHIHVYLLPRSVTETRISNLNRVSLSNFVYPLTKYAVLTVTGFDLLRGEKKDQDRSRPVTHVKKNIWFKMLTGIEELPLNQIPNELENFLRIKSGNKLQPIMHYDLVSDQLSNLVPYDGQDTISVNLKYSPSTLGKFRFMILAEIAFLSIGKFGLSEKDMDQMKGIFSDGNKIYLLCITIVVGSLHILLDILAIKNDVHFWRTRKSFAGLSKKTVMWRAFSQIIVFLFLVEENSSALVTVPTFIGLLIELWKVLKVVGFNWRKMAKSDRSLSQAEKTTENIDSQGMRYLLYILFPLCIAGAIYSLLHDHHKSWYSWTISSLVNGVYAFGFLFMLPQLFINYKMKSVAQLPWRAFMYKAFNTFVDDIFAFIIDMPTAHRIACFRDDFVFLVYLYQRWLYPVDKNRIDESNSFNESPVNVALLKSKKTK